MFTRIRPRILRPWIHRPRGIAVLAAAVVILTNSSVYAQRGGVGCGGVSGGTGAAGQSFAGGAGIPGMTGGGFGNPTAMQITQMQQMQQGLFNVGALNAGPISGGFDVDDHQAWLKGRKAYRAAQAEQRKKRLAARSEKQTKQVALRNKGSSSP